MSERKTPPPVYAIWNDTQGCYSSVTTRFWTAEEWLEMSIALYPDQSFRLVRLVEASLEDGGEVL